MPGPCQGSTAVRLRPAITHWRRATLSGKPCLVFVSTVKRLVLSGLLAISLAGPVLALDDPPLVAAAKAGDVAAVSQILANDGAVDETDWAGWTSLHWAALLLNIEVIPILLDADADIEAIGPGGKNSGTPLMMSAKKLDGIEVMSLLLTRGAAINGTDQYGRTALMISAKHGRTQNVAFLLAQGADPNIRNQLGVNPTALSLARAHGHQKTAGVLIASGALE